MRAHEFLIEQQINEHFVNVFSPNDKLKYVDDVWDILQKSYAPIGGLKGSGFSSKEDMLQNIPFWKLGTRGGKVRVVIMYKDNKGRKSVATGTDRSPESKVLLLDMMKDEFERSYGEKSGPLLAYVKRNFPDLLKQYTINPKDAAGILGKEVEPVDDETYYRTIGGEKVKKHMSGTPGIPLK